VAIEQPRFTVIRTDGRFELRRYDPFIAAETVVEESEREAGSNVGFRRLAGFIFGGNNAKRSIAMTAPVTTTRSEKIAMTAPVETQQGGPGMVMRFMMPSQYTIDTLPTPDDPRVLIRQVPGRTVAVIRFSGGWGEERFEERTEELLTWLREQHITVVGPSVVARYNPPWTPWFMRRNEVFVEIREEP
jgi:hypothetical protein